MACRSAHDFDGNMVDDPGTSPHRYRADAVSRAAAHERHDSAGCGEGVLFAHSLPDFGRRFGQPVCNVVFVIGGNAFQTADGDRLAIKTTAAACRLARSIASTAKNGREHIRLTIEHIGVGKTPLRNEPDIFGHIRVCRTGPLAIHNFVEVIWMTDVVCFQDGPRSATASAAYGFVSYIRVDHKSIFECV